MSPLSIHDASERVAALIRELVDAPGAPWVWPGSVYKSNLVMEPDRWTIVLYVDRDRCDAARAQELAHQISRQFSTAYRGAPPLKCVPTPTRFVEHAAMVVDEHFDFYASRDHERMCRGNETWVRYAGIERVIGWGPADDRLVVEMYADSSADEGNARRLGEAWLAELAERFPYYAALVEVHGSSH